MKKVFLYHCKNYLVHELEKKLRLCLGRIGLTTGRLRPGMHVLLKANLTGPFKPEQAATTHPILVEALVNILQETGVRITLADGPATVRSPLAVTGMQALSHTKGIEVYQFERFTDVSPNSPYLLHEIAYSQDVLEADFLISIPKLKTHALTLYTGAIKNMFGAVDFEQRKQLHKFRSREEFARVLVDVFSIRPPDLTIMDGIMGMQGIGPVHGEPVNTCLLAVAEDAVALDTICAAWMGYTPDQLPFLKFASEKSLGESGYPSIQVEQEAEFPSRAGELKLIPAFQDRQRERFLRYTLGQLDCKEERCATCGECAAGCPAEAIRMAPFPQFAHDRCLHCFRCYEICYRGALRIQFPGKQHATT